MSRSLKKKRRGPRAESSSSEVAASKERDIRLATIAKVAAVLGHESRNLLGALGTCTQVLRRNPHLTADDLEMLDIIQSGGHRLSEIVGQFAIFRRAGTVRNTVDLHAILEEILTRLRQDERCAAEIVIERRFDPGMNVITADAEALRCALWELCLNGAQAIGKQGKLEITTRRAEKKIMVTVSDSGHGIEPSIAQNIFEPLFTTKTRATGLGLAIVKRIVEDHGGTVNLVESARMRGARFVITLPSTRSKET